MSRLWHDVDNSNKDEMLSYQYARIEALVADRHRLQDELASAQRQIAQYEQIMKRISRIVFEPEMEAQKVRRLRSC